MKKLFSRTLFLVLMTTVITVSAQENTQIANPEKMEVTKYTIMERFEPGLTPSVEKRKKLKERHLSALHKRREVLDTLDISERKRQRLLRDILKDPFSPRLARTLAKIEFEEDHQN